MIGSVAAFAAESADAILASAAKAVSGAKSITASFKAVTADGTVNGSLVLAGQKFKLVSPDMQIWYDGQTQWAYCPSTGECNITTPTPEELQQVNPFVIINAFRRNYTARLVSSTGGFKTLQLTSKSAKADIRKVILKLDDKTRYPREITLTDRRGANTRISITSVKAGKALANSVFVFDKRKYPGVDVIDLR